MKEHLSSPNGCRPGCPACNPKQSFTVAELINQALEAFPEFDNDEDVNGGDLVDWFAQWRINMKAAVAKDGPDLALLKKQKETLFDIIMQAKSGRVVVVSHKKRQHIEGVLSLLDYIQDASELCKSKP